MTHQPDREIYRPFVTIAGALLAILVLASLYHYSVAKTGLAVEEHLILTSAQVLPLEVSFDELADVSADWKVVELPFHWRNQFATTRAVWYRLQVSGTAIESVGSLSSDSGDALMGIYIWRINQTADVWFNSSKVGSGSSTFEPMARYWNSPLYFSVPASAIQPINEILIKHYAPHGFGSIEAIVLGDQRLLKPVYEARYFIQHDVALALYVFVLVTGLFCFGVWFYRRQEAQYLWFAFASFGLSVFCLNQFIRYLPVDDEVWRWLFNVAIDVWAVTSFIFILRSLGLKKPVAEKWMFVYLLTGVPVYFYASFYQVFDLNILYHAGSLMIGVSAIALNLSNFWRTKSSLSAFYCSVVVLIMVAGIHDILMQAILNLGWSASLESQFENHFNALHFAAPILFLSIGASLIRRFINSMNIAEQLNEELEARVEDVRVELAESYVAIEQALVYQATSEERERIYRDLHDDVGSKLLSLYYRLEKPSDSMLAKSALEDLRDIVSRKSIEQCALPTAVQQWQREAFNRTHDAGIALSWHFDANGAAISLHESQHAQLRRMLREVLSNAILHSVAATQISVEIIASHNRIAISVTNDGVTEPASNWQTGRGISNLRIRSRDLQGDFSIRDTAVGEVRVSWSIPFHPHSGSPQ